MINDRIILITGSTDGIGKQVALDLAGRGATVLLHGRDAGKAERVRNEIERKTGNNRIQVYSADFSVMAQVRALADRIKMDHSKLDVLINNAGVYMNRKKITADGLEMTFAVNYLSLFILTLELLKLINQSDYKRIINVSSQTHASYIDFQNLQGEKMYSGYSAYALSKLMEIMFTFELAAKLRETGIMINCLHPGVISTKLLHAGWSGGGASIKEGAVTPVYLATSPEAGDVSGKYFINKRIFKPAAVAYNEAIRAKLWEVSEQLSGIRFSQNLL
jgi:NAD(P)-dependent dehydrogenase (short-subunit alcohol dehydrogenase family)